MLKASLWPKVEADTSPVGILLDKLLREPLYKLQKRPSHKFRSCLVEIGVRLAGSNGTIAQKNLAICSEAIEALHLGSLIVDDIQDGSATRRSGAALHTELGIPHALSVGNWLYFHASQKLQKLQLTDSQLLKIQKVWLDAIECAHYGQVLDLATDVSQFQDHEISEICYYTAYYKTGCITGLATALGAIIGGANDDKIDKVKNLGAALGVYLQQLNDLGNLVGEFDEEKRYEDLAALKPSFIWSLALDHFGPKAYEDLLLASKSLPDETLIKNWLKEYPAKNIAPITCTDAFAAAVEEFADSYPEADLNEIFLLRDRIQKAYA